ncbi:hypothetical protein P4B35_23375 [Pontiellaceae bacterium B12227]|nr:hypothetical protein [Pontiellaceae bacterium B12227]
MMNLGEIVELRNGMMIHPDDLQRYVEMRKQLSKRADRSIALMHLLGLLQYCDEPAIEVDPQALAVVADLVDADVTSIQELLDDWLYIVDAEAALTD